MSDIQVIENLCRICEAQNAIIRAQAEVLAQHRAVVMEEERAAVGSDLAAVTASLGRDKAETVQS